MRFCIAPVLLLLATDVLADYYTDNANTSIIYSMPSSQSGQAWQTFSVHTQSLDLQISNSTGNYSILLDASHCYDQNYALGVCGTSDSCFVELPFTGSGITMYVFNAGFSGMTASFSIDGGTAVSNSIDAPPAPTYQISNVSLYDIQGLPTGNHTMKMTLLDWGGGGTSMKFDYAYVNETFVASPARTSSTSLVTSASSSRTSSQTPSAGNSTASNNADVIGATLGGLTLLVGLVMGFFYLRKRKATRQSVSSPKLAFQVNPFTEFNSPALPPESYAHQRLFSSQHKEAITPLTRAAILRDALAAGSYPAPRPDQTSQSTRSGQSSGAFQPLRRPPLQGEDVATHARSSVSHIADLSSPSSDPQIAPRADLTVEQAEVVNRLRQDNVPLETIVRVIEGFLSTNLSAGGTLPGRRFISTVPPPSYQTQFEG